jgi:hypothetical protein
MILTPLGVSTFRGNFRRAGGGPRSARALHPLRTKRNVGLCGREPDGPQLMRISLGRSRALTMPPVSLTRHPGLDYHLAEAKAWLALARDGKASTPLAYAGFELRLAIERILLQYLYSSDPAGFRAEALRLTGKKLENRIYKIAGHQREIDARIRLSEILFEMLGKPGTLARPNLGELARDWQYCSEFCHTGWTLRSSTMSEAEAGAAFKRLGEIAETLSAQVQQLVSMPRLNDPDFVELEKQFLAGQASEEDIRTFLRRRGVWARIERPDGSAEFFGTAVPPAGDPAA